jgi:hypothetical protein
MKKKKSIDCYDSLWLYATLHHSGDYRIRGEVLQLVKLGTQAGSIGTTQSGNLVINWESEGLLLEAKYTLATGLNWAHGN